MRETTSRYLNLVQFRAALAVFAENFREHTI